MKITKDPQRQLNLHPLTVYFMLTPEENEEYGEMLLAFNDKKELTFGLFEFQTLVWANNEDDPDLSDDINALQKKNNIMVRLFNDEDGNYQYATQKLKLNEGYADIAYSVNTFMTKVYKKDYALLKGQGDATAAVFDTLYKQNNGTSGLKSMPLSDGLGSNLNEAPQWLVNQAAADKGISEEMARKLLDQLWDSFEDAIENDGESCQHEITATIKPVLNGKKKVLGVEFTVDSEVIPLYVSNTESKMILFGTLLRKMMNKPLYLHEFRNNNKGKGSEYLTQNQWIHHLYGIITDGKNKVKETDVNRDFDIWSKRQQDPHPLVQGKSVLNTAIRDKFMAHKKNGAKCFILTKHDAEKRTFYDINLKSESIKIANPKQFAELFDNFDEWIRVK